MWLMHPCAEQYSGAGGAWAEFPRSSLPRLRAEAGEENALPTPQRQIVAVDHLGAAFDAEEQHDVARRPALHLLGIAGVVGDEAAADFGAVGAAHDHGIAAGKLAVDANDADRQQAVAAAERRHRAGIDGQYALRLQRDGDPFLARRDL